DAELAHLLRRGGHPLDHISAVVRQIRTAGGHGAAMRRGVRGWSPGARDLGRHRDARGARTVNWQAA
ncbi:hypothetical protein ABZS63_16245, partial [Streptomyces sp. NPDC005568]